MAPFHGMYVCRYQSAMFICLSENSGAHITQGMCAVSENFTGMFTLKSWSAAGGPCPYSFSKSSYFA